MFRIKNDYELSNSPDGDCIIARCTNKAVHEYDNIYNKVPVCEAHFEKLKALAYGE